MTPITKFRADEQVTVRLNLFAAHLGIPRRPFVEGPLWDGSALVELRKPCDLAHEIAHWMLAAPEYRSQVDYGWGWDYQWIGAGPFPEERSDPDEEIRACVLGFAFLARIGFEGLPDLYDAYSFYESTWNGDDHETTWHLTADTPLRRREVQPHVEVFKAWLQKQTA